MPSFQLIVRRGPKTGEIFDLKTQTIIVGRDSSADITINDPEVSRNHCRLILDRSYYLHDLGSTNGTFVDGQRLGGEPQRLKHGQIVQLGSNVTLLYQEASGEDAIMSTMVGMGDQAGTAMLVPAQAPIIDPFNEVKQEEGPDFSGLEAILDDESALKDGDENIFPAAANAGDDRLSSPTEEPNNEQFVPKRPAARPSYGTPPLNDFDDEDDEEDNSRTMVIVSVVVGVLLLCCLCLAVVGIAAYLQSEGQLNSLLGALPATPSLWGSLLG